ncbi:aldehyde dehydrogenase family protein [Streptomyces sp. NPDC019990]|uniref:aldehyde dehydrogenase family protein n=1 Tax=Streptomyces sp. NPDC019990 TaxID=3154693 RepID=UPI00341011DE
MRERQLHSAGGGAAIQLGAAGAVQQVTVISGSATRYASACFRWYVEEAVRPHARSTPSPDGNSRIVTVAEPVGPCLLITPWSVPPAMATRQGRRRPGRRLHRAEGLAVADNTEHGLASYVITSHIDRARRVAALCRPAGSASTAAWSPRSPRPSAGSSSPAWPRRRTRGPPRAPAARVPVPARLQQLSKPARAEPSPASCGATRRPG